MLVCLNEILDIVNSSHDYIRDKEKDDLLPMFRTFFEIIQRFQFFFNPLLFLVSVFIQPAHAGRYNLWIIQQFTGCPTWGASNKMAEQINCFLNHGCALTQSRKVVFTIVLFWVNVHPQFTVYFVRHFVQASLTSAFICINLLPNRFSSWFPKKQKQNLIPFLFLQYSKNSVQMNLIIKNKKSKN